jgi:hypothetical protein
VDPAAPDAEISGPGRCAASPATTAPLQLAADAGYRGIADDRVAVLVMLVAGMAVVAGGPAAAVFALLARSGAGRLTG